MPDTYTNRSPELDFVIAKHEAPTVRLPLRLPSKPTGALPSSRVADTPLVTDDNEEPSIDGILDRNDVKNCSQDFVKRLAKHTLKAAEETRLKLANN